MSYVAVKHLHVLLVVLSIVLFYTRAGARIFSSKLANNKAIFITSHSIDTALLISAIALVVMAGWSPLATPWLMEKIILVVAYIGLGVVAAKTTKQSLRVTLVLVVTAILALIGHLAMSKNGFLLS
ncbi:SirB2 family protein [Pseudoalteromonas fenneropenaei]|uniref:SirB2 family protein n=1 Tax=Pseudoalteromonas fenneropenaei TaxID=1737459 RepID=A0ABV7CGM0_9GAMM